MEIFSIISTFSSGVWMQNRPKQCKANCFNDLTRCAQFLLFDVVSFPFFMLRYKSSTFIRAEQRENKKNCEYCLMSSESFIFQFVHWRCSSYRHSLVILYTFVRPLCISLGKKSYLGRTTANLCVYVCCWISFFYALRIHCEWCCATMYVANMCVGTVSFCKPKSKHFTIFQEEIRSSSRMYPNEMRKSRQWNGFETIKIKT